MILSDSSFLKVKSKEQSTTKVVVYYVACEIANVLKRYFDGNAARLAHVSTYTVWDP